jgi:hypothetical protein
MSLCEALECFGCVSDGCYFGVPFSGDNECHLNIEDFNGEWERIVSILELCPQIFSSTFPPSYTSTAKEDARNGTILATGNVFSGGEVLQIVGEQIYV